MFKARATPAQPDVTLLLDLSGIIREASVSSVLSDENVEGWHGCAWGDTVATFVSDKVDRIVDDARESGISAFRQLTQRFPSGREVPMEYTTVLLGGRAGLLAVGKSLLAVAELQSQFIAAQQTMERDHWKLREIETRYRLLFNHSSEAVLLVRADDLTVIESNPAADRLLGFDGAVRPELLARIAVEDLGPLRVLLQRAQEQGRPPALLVHLGDERHPTMVRASAMKGEPAVLMLQLVPTQAPASRPASAELPPFAAILDGLADAFVLIDDKGLIRNANQTFADLVDMASSAAVTGKSLDRWITRPGANLPVLLATLNAHRTVRLFPSAIRSELDAETEVEISGTCVTRGEQTFHALVIRDIGRRLSRWRDPDVMNALIDSVAEPVGKLPLRQLIRTTVDGVERHYIRAALDLVGGNRTAAAELLGLSRQSLYLKLARYGLDADAQADLSTDSEQPSGPELAGSGATFRGKRSNAGNEVGSEQIGPSRLS